MKKILSCFIIVMMIISMIPVTAFAEEGGDTKPVLTGIVCLCAGSVVIEYGNSMSATIYNCNSVSGNFTYNWYKDDILVNTSENYYTSTVADIGSTIRVDVTADDCTGSISTEIRVIKKFNLTAPDPVTTSAAITCNTIPINTKDGDEYACVSKGHSPYNGDTIWLVTDEFTGLSYNTTYDIYARTKETDKYGASQPSPVARFTTLEAPANALTGKAFIVENARCGETLYINVSNNNKLGEFTYQWKADGENIAGAINNTYEITTDVIGKHLSCEVRDSDTGSGARDGFLLSNMSNLIGKKYSEMPNAPTSSEKTHTSITLNNTTSFNEYRVNLASDDSEVIAWTDMTDNLTIINNLKADTEYKIYQRVKETAYTIYLKESNPLVISTSADNTLPTLIETHSSIPSVTGARTISSNNKGKDVKFDIQDENVKVEFNGLAFKKFKYKKVQMKVEEIDKADLKLSKKLEKQIGDLPIFDISMYVNGEKEHFESDEPIVVEIPVDTDLEEHRVIAVYIDEDGETEIMEGLLHNGIMRFITNHLSDYTLIYGDESFDDIDNHWGKEAIEALENREIVNGVGDGLFNPDGEITRAEFVAMMVRHFHLTSDSSENYADIENDKWYTNYVAIAKNNGILPEIYDTAFEPNKAITREEMMFILYETLEQADRLDSLADNGDKLSDYTDSDKVSDYATEASEYLISRDIIDGNDGQFMPTARSTRAEVAQMIWNMMNK